MIKEDPSLFSSYRTDNAPPVQLADRSNVCVTDRGDFSVHIGTTELCLNDALHVPSLHRNLIVSALLEENDSVTFNHNVFSSKVPVKSFLWAPRRFNPSARSIWLCRTSGTAVSTTAVFTNWSY